MPGPESEYPEPEIDEMRSQRDLLLRRYIQEMERKEAMAARMMSQGGGGLSAGQGDGAGEGEDAEESKVQRSGKKSKK